MSISGSNDIRYIIDKLKELEVRLGGRKNDSKAKTVNFSPQTPNHAN